MSSRAPFIAIDNYYIYREENGLILHIYIVQPESWKENVAKEQNRSYVPRCI